MSEEAAPSSLEDRIQHLEEQNDAFKRSGLLLVILVVVMGATMIYQSRAQTASVQTDGLIISNAGKPRGAITAMPTGHLGMLFFNREGQLPQNVQFASIPYLDGFAIYDRSGKPRILIGMDDKDNPILAVVGPDGKTLFSAVKRAEESAPPTQPAASPTPATTATPQP
jgi:hypothetical protein